MTTSSEIKYTKDHEWIKFLDNDTALVGITGYALEQLGDVVYLELPDLESSFEVGDSFGTVESTKTVSDLYMPLTGKIIATNADLSENLEQLSDDPMNKGWLVKISYNDVDDQELLSEAAYEQFIKDDA